MFSVNGLTKRSLNEIRHDLLLNFSEEPLFEGTDRSFLPAHVEIPYPIHEPLKATETDIVKQLLQEKANYRKLLECKRKKYKFDKRVIVEKKIAGHEYLYLPRHMLDFYREKEPDPYFNCDYNYYYTGGILECLQLNSCDYLIRSNAENKLCLNDIRDPLNTKVINYVSESPIFGIKHVSNCGNDLLVLREKYRVNVVRLIETEEVNELWFSKCDIPILDAKLNPNRPHIGVIKSNLKISVRDVETNRTVFSFKNSVEESDNFQQFQFLDEDVMVLMDRFSVKLLDYRTKSEEKSFDPHLIKCNSLCNFKILGDNLYLASRHYVMKTDLRYLKDLSYYSHMLNTGPCYMDFTTKDDDTYMCLANHVQDDKILFTGKSPYTLPFKVPGIQETLRQCRLRNPSLVLMDHLESRLNFSVAGLKVVNLDGEIFIYSANCLGEIFRQKVLDEQPVVEESAEVLLNWINKLEKPKPVLYLSVVEDMSRARFSLNTNTIYSKLEKYKRPGKAQEFLDNFRPRYSKKNISSNLAADFLAVWDEEDDEEEEDDELPEVPSTDKVTDWIQTHDFSDDENSLGFLFSQNDM